MPRYVRAARPWLAALVPCAGLAVFAQWAELAQRRAQWVRPAAFAWFAEIAALAPLAGFAPLVRLAVFAQLAELARLARLAPSAVFARAQGLPRKRLQ
jgi:hypothetical protein